MKLRAYFGSALAVAAVFTAMPLTGGSNAEMSALRLAGVCGQTCEDYDDCWWQGCEPHPYDECAGDQMFEIEPNATCARPEWGCS